MDIYENLSKHKLEPIMDAPLGGEYVKVKQVGNLLYVSGHGPLIDGEPVYRGKIDDSRLAEGQDAARLCALNILGSLQEYLGDLNRIKGVVKLLAFVASADCFLSQPTVINKASEVFIQAFGEDGRHARSAIGTNVLPGDISVEVEAIFELAE